MDSLTQLALGAAVGEAAAGRQVGRRALLWGAVAGTIPDLDVFIHFGDAVRDFTYHRGASHSLFVLLALTPLLVWLIMKLHPDTAGQRRRWFVMIYLVFATHVLLDSFTVYGTQIFWPFVTTPMSWSTIFIIDPLYTVPLLLGSIAALVAGRHYSWGHLANSIGLALSTGYLAWTLGAKLHVDRVARNALQQQNIIATDVLTTPSPFNSLLWRILAVDDRHYYEGYYSVFDGNTSISFEQHSRQLALVEPLRERWPVQRLQWFTRNFYAAALSGNDILITDLRMGMEPEYAFRFKVGEMANPHARPAPVERLSGIRNYARLSWVWSRIWDAQAEK
jgi:inner membrane protein